MKGVVSILVALLAGTLAAQTGAPSPAVPECAKPGSACAEQESKPARQAFERGMALAKAGRSQPAFEAFDRAAQLAPKSLEYVTAREASRQQVVLEHLQRGNNFLLAGKPVEAMAEFRGAAEMDPFNSYARERLRESMVAPESEVSRALRLVGESGEIELAPAAGHKNFHFRGDSRGLLQEVARAFGVKALLDDSVPSRPLRFDLEDADFATAMRLANQMSKTFWTPLSSSEMLVAADTAENRHQFERMSERTFYLSETASSKEVQELSGLLRTLFDVRFLSAQPEARAMQIRAPQPVLEAVTRFLDGLAGGPPQVEMNVEVLEVSRSGRRNIGNQLPLQFNVFNIPAAALALASTPNIRDLINQLIQSGGINQANSQAVAALLAQLRASPNSLLGQPIATFGGGTTLFGVTIPPATAHLQFNESRVTSLENATLRAAEGDAATLKVGTRFPILNATFAPILNSTSLSRVIQNNSFRPAFPSFQYQDLGLVMKATPHVHSGSSDISLQLELQLSTLGAASLNGIPVLSNRQYTGSITLKEGETAVVAGTVSRSEQQTLAGLPGLGRIPVLGKLTANQDTQNTLDELLVIITPRVARRAEQNLAGQEFWMPPAK